MAAMGFLAHQLRALKDGGLDYTLDDVLSAMERPGARHDAGALGDKEQDVIENLQTIVRSRARKAA